MITNIEKVRDVPIETVVGWYVKVSRKKACCPFHNENSPSFHINQAKGIFKCFGCGEAGDGIGFVMKHENVDFIEAVKIIAQKAGIPIEVDEKEREAYQAKIVKTKNLRETLSWALNYYRNQLTHSDAAKTYLEQRCLTQETIDYWRIGYAPDKWRYLSDYIVGDESPVHATDIGLIAQNKEGRYYDRFRHRIIFPYLDERGQPVSLSGRLVPRPEPKEVKEGDYEDPKALKGNNTAMYDAESYIFGLFQAKEAIRNTGYAVTVEGEIDCIQMHQQGAENTVCIGKFITKGQCMLLKKYTEHVVLMPDNDVAKNGKYPGIEGAERNLRTLLEHGFKVEILIIPDGPEGVKQDPDDFARSFIGEEVEIDPTIFEEEAQELADQEEELI